MGALGGLVSRRLGWDNGGSGSRDAGSLGGRSGGSSKGTGGSVRAFAGVVTLLTAVQAANVNTGWTGVVTVVYSNRADGVKSSLRWLKTRYQGEAKLITVGGSKKCVV